MKLSIVMMIKNEAKHLERCLMSIKPIQAAIDSEIIIVDTGSEDNSVEIARKYTDKVYFHQWNDDFAAMRNITISYASGEWIFVLDGDEVVEKPEEFISFFISVESSKYNTGVLRIKSYATEDGSKSGLGLLPRIFRRDKDFKYIGAIHEQPRVKGPVYYFNTDILHYGYISTDSALMEKKFIRNTEILKSELEKEPENIYYWFQLAQSYETYGSHEEALKANLVAYEIAKKEKSLISRMYVYIHLARVYISNKKYEEAENICLEALALKDGYLDLYYFLAMAQQNLEKNVEAIENYNIYLDMRTHYEDYNGYKDTSTATSSIDLYEEVYAHLSILYFKEDKYKDVLSCTEKLYTNDVVKYALSAIIRAYVKLNMYEELKEFYDAKILMKYEKLANDFTNTLEAEMAKMKKKEKDVIIDIFSHGESLYSLLNLIRKGKDLNVASIQRFKDEAFNKLPTYYGEIIYYLLNNKYLKIDALKHVSDTKLGSYFSYLLAVCKKECAEFILVNMQGTITENYLDKVRIRKIIGKALLLSQIYRGEKYEELFKQYIEDGTRYISHVYNEDIILNERVYDMRNEEDVFLLYMLHAEKTKNKNLKAYINYLKKALGVYPEMAKGIELFTKNIEEPEENYRSASDEMEAYKKRFKENMQALIEKGSLDEVKIMIAEYEKIIQDDTDIYSTRAVIAMMEGNIEEAEAILMKGLDIDAGNFDLLYNLAYLYQSDSQIELAIIYCKEALQNTRNEEDEEIINEMLKILGVQESKQKLLKNEVPKTSIIVLTYNNLKYNKLCIESIRQYTKKGTYEIIVVDNRSTDGTVEWLKEQKDLKLILNDENLGFPKGCNQGIEAAGKDNDILLLNNDTVVTPNWLDNLKKGLYSDEKIGAVGSVTNSCSNLQVIPAQYNNIQEMIEFAKSNNISNPTRWEERVRLVGFCMLIKNEVVRVIGLLDEIFTPGNFEDDDYSYRIRKSGYKLMLCKDSYIYHFGSASFNKEAKKYNNLLIINREKFMKKWGVDPYSITEEVYPTNITEVTDKHQNVEISQNDVNSNNKILDKNLKFILRRIENDINYDENIVEVVNGIKNRKYACKDLIQHIEKYTINKERLLNIIAVECYKEEMIKESIELLIKSYEINTQNKDTVYNLSYITYKLGEFETAITVLNAVQDRDESILSLANEIMEASNER